jgi:hypothetical protein
MFRALFQRQETLAFVHVDDIVTLDILSSYRLVYIPFGLTLPSGMHCLDSISVPSILIKHAQNRCVWYNQAIHIKWWICSSRCPFGMDQ